MRVPGQSSSAMSHISDFFAVYKKRLRPPQKTVEKAAALVITSVTGITVNDTTVSFNPSTRVLMLNLPSVIKTEIFLQRTAVLRQLQTELGADQAPLTLL